MNIAVISGNLGKDPEVKYTKSGTSLCEFQLAVKSGYGENVKTNWISVVTWGGWADTVGEHAEKGSTLTVRGEIETGSYDGDNGKVYYTKLNASEVYIIKKKDDDEEDERPKKKSKPADKKSKSKSKSKYNPMDDDEDDEED